MTPDRWTRAVAVAAAAARQGPSERAAFLAQACAGDDELRTDVEALLRQEAMTGESGSEAQTRGTSAGRWGPFTLVSEAGRGGFGCVYRAYDPSLRRDVALKLIPVPSGDPAFAESVLKEGRLLTRVRHPNIVTVFGAAQQDDRIGVWMEFIEGRTLANIVERDGPMGPDEAAVAGLALCSALAAVHASGIVHGDVKARNVMRAAGGRIVLMDFGAGRERSQPALELAGTPMYMAPEVLRGAPATPASDVYSAGVLLFYLVTGRYPVQGRTFGEMQLAHARGERLSLAECRPDLPDAFVHAVERALAPAPADRYRSATQFRQQLAAAVAARPAADWRPARPGPPRQDSESSRRRRLRSKSAARRARVQAVAIGLLAAIVTLTFLGFGSTMAFNTTLGRTGPFAAESPVDWLTWGTRALLGPIVYMLAIVLLTYLARGFVTLLAGVWKPAPAAPRAPRFERLRRTLRLDDPSAFSNLVALAGGAALLLVCWRCSELLLAVTTYASTARPEELAALQPASAVDRFIFRRSLDAIILGLVLGLHRAVRLHRADDWKHSTGSLLTGFAVLALAVLLSVIPYRILFQNEFERVDLEGQRCYLLGRDAGNVLVYCPEAPPPRNRVVSAGDARLRRLGIVESVFTPRETVRAGGT